MRVSPTLALLVTIASLTQPASAQSHHSHEQPASTDASREAADVGRLSIPDVVLSDQQGQQVHFYNDLVKGKVVVINFIFTTCTTICPPMGANFAQLQRMMAERKRSDLKFISISVDPTTDTPAKLKEWSEQFHPPTGWTLLTGPKSDVDKVLKALKVYTPRKDDHTPVVLIGSESDGKWVRAYGLSPPAKLVEVIDTVVAQSSSAQSRKQGQQ